MPTPFFVIIKSLMSSDEDSTDRYCSGPALTTNSFACPPVRVIFSLVQSEPFANAIRFGALSVFAVFVLAMFAFAAALDGTAPAELPLAGAFELELVLAFT